MPRGSNAAETAGARLTEYEGGNARNLAAYDRLPRPVRDWMKGALLQYHAVSVLSTYRKWRAVNPTKTPHDFVLAAAARDAQNACAGTFDPAYMPEG